MTYFEQFLVPQAPYQPPATAPVPTSFEQFQVPQAPYQPPATAPVPAQAPVTAYDFYDDLAYIVDKDEMTSFEQFQVPPAPAIDPSGAGLQGSADGSPTPSLSSFSVVAEVNLPALPPQNPGLQAPAQRSLELAVRIREPSPGSAPASSSALPRSFEVSPRPIRRHASPRGTSPVSSFRIDSTGPQGSVPMVVDGGSASPSGTPPGGNIQPLDLTMPMGLRWTPSPPRPSSPPSSPSSTSGDADSDRNRNRHRIFYQGSSSNSSSK
ncbi:hypothetical protein Mp_1g06070 [Marchantia polymorpha subsp. ruderalis]|uniref:Uncharacterized protein n=2 Tax=Marchantia polymorpha TaxID=3197 RepID=A0AAF6AM13_MARPO|nr:hypothetical protein MARPO_0005s0002 [Marchantia polymorpha]BBM97483.1 hypothetical protein Mp_1g06070 [Marchantia polymorpha subsp. ruderalis]|eukprot:PTQ48321.1 hypothetical protein MARPO_0005s0002 [Marchantia polymorpha]